MSQPGASGAAAEGAMVGQDSQSGQEWSNMELFWQSVLAQDDPSAAAWYAGADKYWDTQAATVDGMLGGYGKITGVDLASSWKFIAKATGKKSLKDPNNPSRALDCGAGIGRITEGLLVRICDAVDLLEQNKEYVRVAEQNLAGKTNGRFICAGLQDWAPQPGEPPYEVIWVQWVSLYLTDEHFVEFLHRCAQALSPTGLVYFKDNCSGCSTFQLDADDNSICRSDKMYRELFSKAGWRLVLDEIQQHFPEELYEVRMYALAPPGR